MDQSDAITPVSSGASQLRVGVDTIRLSDILGSIESLGSRFAQRLFTAAERGDPSWGTRRTVSWLGERYAAKEAALKALDGADVGIDWRHIEILTAVDGSTHLALHGTALERAHSLGVQQASVSMSAMGDRAMAVVTMTVAAPAMNGS